HDRGRSPVCDFWCTRQSMLTFFYRILENPRVYDLVQRLLGGERIHRTIREVIDVQLRDITYNTVLDVGCGTGLFTDCFEGEYTGIDINQDYIRRAETKGSGCFLVADATALPFGPWSLPWDCSITWTRRTRGRCLMRCGVYVKERGIF
ncbi:MAG: class I SAM-dependent methyltransferase, partial [Nitrospirae bacterium]|nr:class I SAM-dependent methyltransferase [Nitrospirota bacterium]